MTLRLSVSIQRAARAAKDISRWRVRSTRPPVTRAPGVEPGKGGGDSLRPYRTPTFLSYSSRWLRFACHRLISFAALAARRMLTLRRRVIASLGKTNNYRRHAFILPFSSLRPSFIPHPSSLLLHLERTVWHLNWCRSEDGFEALMSRVFESLKREKVWGLARCFSE
jgi:hypothetical protein